jgi:protein TonB
MNYAALLFCPEDKTSRVLSQVLADLDFAVELSTEPFAAVKRLMAQRFDAVVVDCDNDQNAALMFKSVRNSESNQAALTVAVVADQAGVAKAFRLGANLVLTKPINVEQSKSTLRVAKGLLKKGEGTKPAAAAATAPVPQPASTRPAVPARPTTPAAPIVAPKPVFVPPSTPSRVVPTIAASALELEPEPLPPTAPDDAALLESMPAPANPLPKQNRWPAASESVLSKQAASHADAHSGSAAAAAPAKEKIVESKTVEHLPSSNLPAETIFPEESSAQASIAGTLVHAEAPVFSSFPASSESETSSDGSGKKIAIAVAAMIAIGALAYFLYGKSHTHTAHQPTALQSQQAQTISVHANDASANPSVSSLNPVISVPEPITKPAPIQGSGSSNPSANQPSAKSAPSQASAEKPSERVVDKSAAAAKTADATPEPEPLMVKREAPQPPPAPQAETPTPEPPSMSVSASNSAPDLSGIVGSAPVSIPRPTAQTIRVSQGVSQGLLIKKVDPVYPKPAMDGRIQGAVQLDAHIAKDGSISSVKVLSGDPVLAAAAADAVKQWKYKPYFLDGQPISIQTQITVNFKLP